MMILRLQFLFWFLSSSVAKIHDMLFLDDSRPYIRLLEFGFLPNGWLEVDITKFFTDVSQFQNSLIGFTLSKGDEVDEVIKSIPGRCVLLRADSLGDVIYFIFNFEKKALRLQREGDSVLKLQVCASGSERAPKVNDDRNCYSNFDGNSSYFDDQENDLKKSAGKIAPVESIPLKHDETGYSAKFSVNFMRKIDAGQYYLTFHNCKNYGAALKDQVVVSFRVAITAKNHESYLSAGEIINPEIYFGLAILFFATAMFWIHFLKSTKNPVYKIHYLMAVLVILKSFSLFFHGINYYVISVHGQQQAVWAVVYYIMHLLKGLMLFGVIILIGTGWTFFKNFLTDRDRRLFMVVIPMQILDNIALIITEESEIGQKSYSFWLQLLILIDLICCATIILPVIWSIRHLQEASRTDGKAAFNLKKLKLFRHFYIIVICYIYLTRIVNYLVVLTIPFQYTYIVVLVVEIGSWLFYVLTGYKFRPSANNPYLKLADSDDDDDSDNLEDVLLQSGALQNIVRVNTKNKNKKRSATNDELTEAFILKETSHELD